MKASVIVPVYNEESVIESCLRSLQKQTEKDIEIIVVDDGSTDQTKKLVTQFKDVVLLTQNHQGTGAARNLGASKAKGDVLVFVDSDMEFAPSFIKDLIAPIVKGETIGTFSTNEGLLNKTSPWAVAWNQYFSGSTTHVRSVTKTNEGYLKLKKFLEKIEERVAPINHNSITTLAQSHNQLPFRAISKKVFNSVNGFTLGVGYTDDWTLAEKLMTLPTATAAEYYHRSPETPKEIWRQGNWIGRDKLKSGNIVRRVNTILKYNPLVALLLGVKKSLILGNWRLLPFTLIYSTAVLSGSLSTLINPQTGR